MGEKKAGGAAMIKISWVAVFDPQYATIVSARLHWEPNAAEAREDTIYKLSHSSQKVAGSAEFASFLRIKKPPPASTLNPPAPGIIYTLAFHWPVSFLKNTLKRRGNTSMWGQTQKVVTLFNGAALRLVNVTPSEGVRRRSRRNV